MTRTLRREPEAPPEGAPDLGFTDTVIAETTTSKARLSFVLRRYRESFAGPPITLRICREDAGGFVGVHISARAARVLLRAAHGFIAAVDAEEARRA